MTDAHYPWLAGRLVAVLLVAAVAVPTVAVAAAHVGPDAARVHVAATDAACGSPNPYLATTRFPSDGVRPVPAGAAVVFAFRDTPDDAASEQIPLATYGQVGATFGLAHDAESRSLFVGAYTRRDTLFGPGGAGAIYRADLTTGVVTSWATLDAGRGDLHDRARDRDVAAAAWVGRSGLGDLEIGNVSGRRWLFAANLYDGTVVRLDPATGAVADAFGHGGAAEPWGDRGRPSGPAVHGGWLYHGVVEPHGDGQGIEQPVGHVYRSRADGTSLDEVARFELSADETDPSFVPWTADAPPALSDIDFLSDGRMVVAVRNLAADMVVDDRPSRLGDLALGVPSGDGWEVAVYPESRTTRSADGTSQPPARSRCCPAWTWSSPPAMRGLPGIRQASPCGWTPTAATRSDPSA